VGDWGGESVAEARLLLVSTNVRLVSTERRDVMLLSAALIAVLLGWKFSVALPAPITVKDTLPMSCSPLTPEVAVGASAALFARLCVGRYRAISRLDGQALVLTADLHCFEDCIRRRLAG